MSGATNIALRIPGADSLILFGRTDRHPETLLWREDIARDSQQRPVVNPYGYYLHVGVAKELAELPTGFPAPGTQGYVAASFDPVI